MPTSKKPRKPHKPKPCGTPLNKTQRLQLELATRTQIDALYHGRLTEKGWHTLAAHFNVLTMAFGSKFQPAMDALQSIAERAKRTGKIGATGDERKLVVDTYNESINDFLRLSDDTVRRAINRTYEKVTNRSEQAFTLKEAAC